MILFYAENHYHKAKANPPTEPKINKETNKDNGHNIAAQTFTFRELAAITRNFRQENLIGEGGFGRVYKGRLEKTNQVRICHFFIHCYVLLYR